MDILKTKTVLALGISGAISAGTANADITDTTSTEISDKSKTQIISVSSPNLKVTVYDGIATLVGTAETLEQAQAAEQEIQDLVGIEYVINMITWG